MARYVAIEAGRLGRSDGSAATVFECMPLIGNRIVGVFACLQSIFSLTRSLGSGSRARSVASSIGKNVALGAGKSAVSMVARDIGRSIGGDTCAREILFASAEESVLPCWPPLAVPGLSYGAGTYWRSSSSWMSDKST